MMMMRGTHTPAAIFLALTVWILSIDSSLQQEDDVCHNETESQFRLVFHNLSDADIQFPSSGSIVWKLQRNRHDLNGTLRYQSYTSWNDIPQEETVCLPRNDCILFVIEDLNPEQFQIWLGGDPISNVGPAYPAHAEGNSTKSTTQVGRSCIPTCSNDNEALFHMTVFTAASGRVDWQVILFNQQVVASCSAQSNGYCDWDPWETYYIYQCLPTNGACYQFLWSDASWIGSSWDFHRDRKYHPAISLALLDDKENSTVSFQSTRFESVPLRREGSICDSQCQEDEAVLEFFVSRNDDTNEKQLEAANMEWSLVDRVQDSVVTINAIAWAQGQSWQYVQECVKRDACLQFFLSVPETPADAASGSFQLVLDGILYADNQPYHNTIELTIKEIFTIGTCQSNEICFNPDSESLMSIGIQGQSSEYFNLDMSIEYDDGVMSAAPSGYFLYNQSRYRHYGCIPKQCFTLEVNSEGPVGDRYNVTIDGEYYIDWMHGSGVHRRRSLDCHKASGLSRGAFAAILGGSLFSGLVCMCLVCRILGLRKAVEGERRLHDDDDKTIASDCDPEPVP